MKFLVRAEKLLHLEVLIEADSPEEAAEAVSDESFEPDDAIVTEDENVITEVVEVL